MFQNIKAEPNGALDDVIFCTLCIQRCIGTGKVILEALPSEASLSLEV